jgi:hypothetical protein
MLRDSCAMCAPVSWRWDTLVRRDVAQRHHHCIGRSMCNRITRLTRAPTSTWLVITAFESWLASRGLQLLPSSRLVRVCTCLKPQHSLRNILETVRPRMGGMHVKALKLKGKSSCFIMSGSRPPSGSIPGHHKAGSCTHVCHVRNIYYGVTHACS